MMGMEFQAITTLGFNNADQKMALTSVTNMGTGILSLYGNWNSDSRSAILLGELTNPVSKNTIHVRQVLTFPDRNTILIENFDKEGENPERKTVQYKLIRNA